MAIQTINVPWWRRVWFALVTPAYGQWCDVKGCQCSYDKDPKRARKYWRGDLS